MSNTRKIETLVKEIIKELDLYMRQYPNTYKAVKKLLYEIIEIDKRQSRH